MMAVFCCWQSLPATEFSNISYSLCRSEKNRLHTHASKLVLCHLPSPRLCMRGRSGVATNIGTAKSISEGHCGLCTPTKITGYTLYVIPFPNSWCPIYYSHIFSYVYMRVRRKFQSALCLQNDIKVKNM